MIHAVCQFCPLRRQVFQYGVDRYDLPLIVGLHVPVVLLGDLTVFPVLIERLFVAGDFCKLPLFG